MPSNYTVYGPMEDEKQQKLKEMLLQVIGGGRRAAGIENINNLRGLPVDQGMDLDAANNIPMPSSKMPPQSYSASTGLTEEEAAQLNERAPASSPTGEERQPAQASIPPQAAANLGQAVASTPAPPGMQTIGDITEKEKELITRQIPLTDEEAKMLESQFKRFGLTERSESNLDKAEKAYEDTYKELTGGFPEINYQGALMLADSLLGTKNAQAYTPPKSRADKLRSLLDERLKMSDQSNKLLDKLTDYFGKAKGGMAQSIQESAAKVGVGPKPRAGLEDNRRNRQIEIDVKKLSSDMSPYVKYVEALRGIKGTLNNMSKSGVPMAIPQRLALNDPTKDISDLRRQTLKIVNSLLKEQSGTAVSAQEAARKFKEEGLHPLSTNEAFFSGLEELSSELQKSAQNVFNGYSSEVVGRWKGVKPSDITILGRPSDDREKQKKQREEQRKKIEAELKKLGG